MFRKFRVIRISVNDKGKNIFKSLAKVIDNNIDRFNIIEQFTQILNRQYPTKILYGLLKLKFSSYTELAKFVNAVDLREFSKWVNKLRHHGILKNIYMSSPDYKFIYVFWKEEYKHSSSRPALYKLSDEWKPLIKTLDIILKSRAGDGVDEKGIDDRNTNYLKYCDRSKKQIAYAKEIEKNSLGRCYDCERIITKLMQPKIDYTKYGNIFICSLCNKKADVETIRKWIALNS